MNITIIGSGYVGTTAAGLFALSGHNVTALDIDEKKVVTINAGEAPFYEQGLDEVIAEGVKGGALRATTDYELAIKDADFVLSCVGTPDRPDGSADLQYVYKAAEMAAQYLKKKAIYVQKSTVPVGTGREVIELLPAHVAYVSNPEFLREGTAIYDTLLFDRVVAGSDDQSAVQKVLDLHRTVEQSAAAIARVAGLDIAEQLKTHGGEYIGGQLESAELIKVTANAFLALKISFANSIAKLADQAGADITEIMDGVGIDKRIGRAFLSAGRGYGGGCFPKDVSGLISSAAAYGVDMPIMTATTEVNESMPGYIASQVEELLGGSLQGKKVAVLGLAFKAGTSDARKSPGVRLANLLHKAGAIVSVYDPHANNEAGDELHDTAVVCGSALEAAKNANAVFIATAWTEFSELDMTALRTHMAGDIVYDADNALSRKKVQEAKLRYFAVGRT